MTELARTYIPCKKIADFCGVSETKVDNWLASGNLPSQLQDGEQQVYVGDLVDFMHRNHLAIPFELMQYEKQLEADTSVLIVEEDRSAAQRIEEVMKSLSLKVTKVANGFDATLHCLQKKPNLITLDLGLGDMSGIEFIENIVSNQQPRAKILVISDSMPSLIAKAKNAGADAIVPKPFDQDTLKRSARILLKL